MATPRINPMATGEDLSIAKKKNTDTQQDVNSYLINKAQSLGISVEAYYIYDENNQVTGIDTAKLNAAIQEAMQAQKQKAENNQYQDDTFEKTTVDTVDATAVAKSKAKSSQNTIDAEYSNAALKYAESLNFNADSTSEEGKLAAGWDAIEADANRLTSATASNTTVLEGVKEFITTLTGLINDTKNYNAQKEGEKASNISFDTERDIQDKNNDIEAHETNFFTSNPFQSAFETFGIEEEEEVAV